MVEGSRSRTVDQVLAAAAAAAGAVPDDGKALLSDVMVQVCVCVRGMVVYMLGREATAVLASVCAGTEGEPCES